VAAAAGPTNTAITTTKLVTDDLRLGFETMDTLHDEFEQLLARTRDAKGADFLPAFADLIAHTESHFQTEEALMQTYNFHGFDEHTGEHRTLLDEMRYFYEKGQKMPLFARNYVNEYAFEKFRRHVINIDSQLAAFLKELAHA